MKKRILSSILVLVLITTAFTGCGSSSTNSSTPAKDTVTIVIPSDITTLEPYDTTVLINEAVKMNIYETLLDYYQGKFTPLLCESYSVSDDGLSYTFNLKKGITCHNGEELKASDVAFSLKRAKDSKSFKAVTASIKDVTAADDYTVKVLLSQPDAAFLILVASKVAILNEKAANAAGSNINTTSVGTGPYTFSKWDAGQQIVLERFDKYHGEKPAVKTATYVIIGDASSAQIAVETGEKDLTYTVPSVAVKELEKNDKLTVSKVRTLGSGYLVYNLEKAPFNDVNFRKAINYSIDKQKIIDIALDGNGEISTGVWNKDTMGYSDKVQTYKFDEEKSKEALAASSYKGQTITFKVRDEQYKKIAVIMQEEWRKIGINAEIQMVEPNSWISDMQKGNFELSFVIMTKQPDAADWASVFMSEQIGVLNFSRAKYPAIDEAFNKGKVTTDLNTRTGYYDTVLQGIKDEAIIAPVFYRVMTPVYQKTLKINKFYPTGYAKIQDMKWN